MALKILTVDDSRAVRIIVKKAFKQFECDLVEAANGVEGLAAASKENPDIILLDVTMPVMDGVEMLTKLKADPVLKGTPVVMLTAEAGREMVLKIAKLGIRDYIVKPFKEDVLTDKVARIIDLRPLGESNVKQKGMSDNCEILIVEDKPVIIEQIKQGLANTPWTILGANSSGEAIDICNGKQPDLIVVSLTLEDNAAATLYRLLRANVKTKYIPVFGLAVKTALAEQQQAQQLGFSSIVTKPIDFPELESKIAKAINLDTSEKYFSFEEDYLLISLPESSNSAQINEVSSYLKEKISDAVDNGYYKVIFDAHALKNVNMSLIKLLVQTKQNCRELTLSYSLVANNDVALECRGFEETKDWVFHESIEDAKQTPVKV